ncbi:Rossmann-fold NAD(P)-binding domain-containing protein [Microbacterium saperdae]|uniref:hypothetical protein n=1 Tax=Microbacterium saperdae TaxID=69368 RepID=UPI001151EABA|nr:hypothetical protein [Microbacterium saperdae]GGM62639.1 hypothetical protein GCM10010489_37630 [Microbacterium saperdae]
MASASRADYAAAAAVVLTTEDPATIYELCGDDAWTQQELGTVLTEVLGRDISVQNTTADQHAEILRTAGVPEGIITLITEIDTAIAAGDLAQHPGSAGQPHPSSTPSGPRGHTSSPNQHGMHLSPRRSP